MVTEKSPDIKSLTFFWLNNSQDTDKTEIMSHTNHLEAIKVESIFHPSDFSQASEVAFAHALKIALVTKAKLNMLHVTADLNAEWHEFPGVRDTLERWKHIPNGSPGALLDNLALTFAKRWLQAKIR